MSTVPPSEVDPSRQTFAETLGKAPGRGRLAGRRILVVGGGQRATVDENPPVGNGRAISLLFAREGAQIACMDMSLEAADATCAMIGAEGGSAFSVEFNVLEADRIAAVVDDCAARMGGLDGLVLVVGVTPHVPLADISIEQWQLAYDVNVRAHMLFCKRAIQIMDPGGSIVIISSLSALRADARNPAYETSKNAQIALARSVAMAGEPKGIRCNSVAPGVMDTPMGRDAGRKRGGARAAGVPFGRQGTAWEVAYGTLFLMSGEASYVNGHCLLVDGGFGVQITRPAEAPKS